MSDRSQPEPWSPIGREEGAATEVSDLSPPPTTPAGWYDDPDRPGSLRYWDGTTWAESNTPGWKDVGDSFLWWDGQQYTARATWDRSTWKLYRSDGTASTTPLSSDPRREQLPSAPPRGRPPPRRSRTARWSMIGLIIAGCIAFFWWSVATEPDQCPGGTQVTYSESGAAWVSWFVLVGLALAGLTVWWTLARRSTWIMVAAILGVVAAVGTSPLAVSISGASECSFSATGSGFQAAVEAGRQTNHQEELALGETPFIVRHVVPVDGYTYVDAREFEIRNALANHASSEELIGQDFYGGLSLHGIVADDPSQNTAGRLDGGREVGFFGLVQLNLSPPYGIDEEFAVGSYLGDVPPIDRLEVAGVPVFVFEDPSSDDSRYTYQWIDHGVQGFIDGADREPIERWVRAYLAIPKLGENETIALYERLTDIPGFGYADYDPASTTYDSASLTDDLLGPVQDIAHSAHKVADEDGKFGLLVLAETDDGAPLVEMMADLDVDVVGEIELGGQRVRVLEGFSDGIDGRGFIWTESEMSGSLSTNADSVEQATRFLEAFLQS